MTIDKLETQIEKLIEKAKTLHFPFKNGELEKEADEDKEAIIASLESFLELASKDWEESPPQPDEDEENS